MVKASFEHDGDTGTLSVTTHFDRTVKIACDKRSDESFRLGGTAVHTVVTYEGLVLQPSDTPVYAYFRAFRTPEDYFDSVGVLSSEQWPDDDRHCYVTEYYPLDMEGKRPNWFISRRPIQNANHLFINLDILDGGGNVMRRFRVSSFTGEHCVMERPNG